VGGANDPNQDPRLAPNMFPLTRQVQTACDTLRNAACLAGREPKRFEDNEKTLEDLKARIAGCLSYVRGFGAEDYDGAEARPITRP
jgi:uncharacterized protein